MSNTFYGILLGGFAVLILFLFVKVMNLSINDASIEVTPWNESSNIKTWNEIPVNLYPIKDDVPYRIWIQWAKEPTTICRLSSIQMYYEIGDEYPKLKKFIRYAAKSTNGIDNADCAAMIALAKEHDQIEERKEFNEGVKELVKT